MKIERGIAIPPKKSCKGTSTIIDLISKMEPGDSIFREGDPAKAQNALNSYAVSWKKKQNGAGEGVKFVTRQVENGARIWRVE